MGAASTVLLKNTNSALPLKDPATIAVIGRSLDVIGHQQYYVSQQEVTPDQTLQDQMRIYFIFTQSFSCLSIDIDVLIEAATKGHSPWDGVLVLRITLTW